MTAILGYCGMRPATRQDGRPFLIGRLDREVTIPAGAIVVLRRVPDARGAERSHVLIVVDDPTWRDAPRATRERVAADNSPLHRTDPRPAGTEVAPW